MKKIIVFFITILTFSLAHAQFAQDTKYINSSLSNMSLEYSQKTCFNVGMNFEMGYFIADGVMLRSNVGFNRQGATKSNQVTMGTGVKYYFVENGISLGTGLEYAHQSPNINNLFIPFEVGYTFYLNHYLAVEPTLYYRLSTNDFANGSKVGFRIGLGFYF